MSEWILAGPVSMLAEGEHITLDVNGVEVALFRINDKLLAIEDVCSHDGAEIASGRIEEGAIICPRHGARFCLETGKALCAPAYVDIAAYPVRIVDGEIEVGTIPKPSR